MPLSDAQRRFLLAAYLWAGLSIAGAGWWLVVSWDEYRHLDNHWRSMLEDLPDVFIQSLIISLATAGFLHFLRLPERKRLPMYASLAAGGVTWFFSAFVIACLEMFYATMYVTHHSSGGSGFPAMSRVMTILFDVMRLAGKLLSGWKMPLAFALLAGLIIYGISRSSFFRRWFIRSALSAPVGLTVGVLLVLSWHWLQLPGWYSFSCRGYDYPSWFKVVLGAAAGSLHAFLFSGLTRYLIARREYWEGRGE